MAHGPGLSLGVDLGGAAARLVPEAWIEGQYQLPSHARAESIGVGISTLVLRAGGGARWAFAGGAAPASPLAPEAIDVHVGLGADFVHLSPEPGTATGATVALTGPHWSESLIVTAAAALHLSAGRHLALAARLFGDLLPTSVHYDAVTDGVAAPVFSPRRLRGGLALALILR